MATARCGRGAARTLLAPELSELPLRLAATVVALLGLLAVTTVAAVLLPSLLAGGTIGAVHTAAIVGAVVVAVVQFSVAVGREIAGDE